MKLIKRFFCWLFDICPECEQDKRYGHLSCPASDWRYWYNEPKR